MANRAVVRARPLVIALLAIVGLGADAPATRPAWERRPYAIRALIAFDPNARWDAASQQAVIESWRQLTRRFVGAPWSLDIRLAEGVLDTTSLDAMADVDLVTASKDVEQLWVIRVEADARGGASLLGRDWDVATKRLGPLRKRMAPDPDDLPRSLMQLSFDLFAPAAEILSTLGDVVQLSVQGAGLTPADPVGRVVAPGQTFLAFRLFEATPKRAAQVVPVPWTYLTVEEVDGPVARCSLLSALRDPLSKRVSGTHRLVALGVKPAPLETRLRFVTRPPNPAPAAGYRLMIRNRREGTERAVGTTDRDGVVILPAGVSDRPLIARLLGGGIEPLVEFPVLPGESAEERVLRIDPLDRTVVLESDLDALRDELVDLIAQRARYESLIKARAEGNAWAEVKTLLDEYRRFPTRAQFAQRLAALRDEAKREQDQSKRVVLTRTALARLDDTQAMIERYLDDEFAQAYADALRDAQDGGVLPPSADWKPFTPRGLGFRVLIPGTPQPTQSPVLPGGQPEVVQTFATDYQGRRYIVQSFALTDAQQAMDDATLQTELERLWDEFARGRAGVSIRDRVQSPRGALLATDFRLEGPLGLGDPQATQLRVRQLLDRAARRCTVLAVGGRPSTLDGREGSTFLNSFTTESEPAAPGVSQPEGSR
jgi:hypothetical protein